MIAVLSLLMVLAPPSHSLAASEPLPEFVGICTMVERSGEFSQVRLEVSGVRHEARKLSLNPIEATSYLPEGVEIGPQYSPQMVITLPGPNVASTEANFFTVSADGSRQIAGYYRINQTEKPVAELTFQEPFFSVPLATGLCLPNPVQQADAQ